MLDRAGRLRASRSVTSACCIRLMRIWDSSPLSRPSCGTLLGHALVTGSRLEAPGQVDGPQCVGAQLVQLDFSHLSVCSRAERCAGAASAQPDTGHWLMPRRSYWQVAVYHALLWAAGMCCNMGMQRTVHGAEG